MDLVQTLARIGADPALRYGPRVVHLAAPEDAEGLSRDKLYCTVFPVREDEPQPDESPKREDDEAPAETDEPSRGN